MLRFHTIALGLALCAGGAVTTNAQAGSSPAKSDTTAFTARHDRRQMRGPRRGGMERADRALFRGIDLSSAQKARLDSIRSKYRSESKSMRDQMGPAVKDMRAARQSGDSAKIREARASMSASREKMQALHKQEVSEIRGVLTPEQQTTFDKNVSQMQNRMQQGRAARKGAHGAARTGAHKGASTGASTGAHTGARGGSPSGASAH